MYLNIAQLFVSQDLSRTITYIHCKCFIYLKRICLIFFLPRLGYLFFYIVDAITARAYHTSYRILNKVTRGVMSSKSPGRVDAHFEPITNLNVIAWNSTPAAFFRDSAIVDVQFFFR